MFFSLCYSLGGFKIFCLFAMFALVNIKYKRKPAKNEINVYSACLWFITLFHCVWVWMVFIIRNGARCWTAPWSLSATATAACRCWHCLPGAAAFTIGRTTGCPKPWPACSTRARYSFFVPTALTARACWPGIPHSVSLIIYFYLFYLFVQIYNISL